MAFPTMGPLDGLAERVLSSFQDLYAQLEGWLRIEHHEDGTHADISADSLTVEGDIEGGGDGTFDGNVTADADSEPVIAGLLTAVSNTRQVNGIDMRSAATSRWRIGSYNSPSNQRELVFIDMLETSQPYVFRVKRTAANAYMLQPEGTVALTVGEDAVGGRLTELTASTARVGTLYVSSTLPAGRWNAITYAAGNFTGGGSMTWTVDSGDVTDYSYMRLDKTAIVSVWLDNTVVGGTPDTSLLITLPFTVGSSKITTCELFDNGALVTGVAYVTSGTTLVISRLDRANFTAGTVAVHAQIAVEIA